MIKNAPWLLVLGAALVTACNAEVDDGEDVVASEGSSLSCDQRELATCRQYGGGKACESKWCSSSGPATGNATATGARLASLALRRDGRRSGGRCYEHVYYAIRDSGIASQDVLDRYGVGYGGAWDFARFGEADPSGMERVGFRRVDGPVSALPRGSILVWRPGQCGYSSSYGHIEIVVGGGRACSDFCGSIATGCGAPVAYVPVR